MTLTIGPVSPSFSLFITDVICSYGKLGICESDTQSCCIFSFQFQALRAFLFPQAANPGCVLEDFVRWYSPRDYVEEEVVDEKGDTVVTGTLSPRMKIPGNMWVEAWDTARVTPARRQKRLFDDTKEAEKVTEFSWMKPQTTKCTTGFASFRLIQAKRLC